MAAAPNLPPSAPAGARMLNVRVPMVAGATDLLRLLGPDAPTWLGEETASASLDGAGHALRRFATDLRLRVSDRSERALFRKAAIVELGEPVRSAGAVSVEIGWRASTLAPLFPVFSGRLTISRHEAVLRGLYAPPGGRIGQIADTALFHIAAEGTARWLLRELEAILTDAAR